MFATQFSSLARDVQIYNKQLAYQCERNLGVGLSVFKALKQTVHLGSLVLAGYAISQGAEPFTALLFAAIIISGPEMLEWWLLNQDYPQNDDE